MEYCQYSLYPCPCEADMSSWDSGSSPECGSSDLCTATSGSCIERRVPCFVTPWYTAPPAPCHTSAYSTRQYSEQGHERIKQMSVSFLCTLGGVYTVRSKRPCERGWGAWRSRPPCGSGRTPRPERGCQQTPVEWPAAGLGRSASSHLLLCTVYTHIHTTRTEVCMLISYIRLFTCTIVYI